MAIKFEDRKEHDNKLAQDPAREAGSPKAKAPPPSTSSPDDDSDAETHPQLPFAKPVKAEKKKRGR